jgi:hypothetical protein
MRRKLINAKSPSKETAIITRRFQQNEPSIFQFG